MDPLAVKLLDNRLYISDEWCVDLFECIEFGYNNDFRWFIFLLYAFLFFFFFFNVGPP